MQWASQTRVLYIDPTIGLSPKPATSGTGRGPAFVRRCRARGRCSVHVDLQERGKTLAGGPVSGTVALALLISAGSAKELDDPLTGFPGWSRMETEVTPLTTFDAPVESLRPPLEEAKAQALEIAMSAPGSHR